MSAWRSAAIEKIPGCRNFIQHEENIWQLWIGLWDVFTEAHRNDGRPHDVTVSIHMTYEHEVVCESYEAGCFKIVVDEQTIAQIASYASWCLLQPGVPEDPDVASAAIVDFWEQLPTDPLVRQRLPEWLSAENFNGMINIFRYYLSAEEHERFVQEFYGKLGISKEEQDRMYKKSFGPKSESSG